MDDFFNKIRTGATLESDGFDREKITISDALNRMDSESEKIMVTNMEPLTEEAIELANETVENTLMKNNSDKNQKRIFGLKPLHFGLLSAAVIVGIYFGYQKYGKKIVVPS